MPLHWFNRNDTSSQVQQQHRLGFRIVFVVLASTLLFASLISAVLIYRAYQAAVTDAKAQTLVIEKIICHYWALHSGRWMSRALMHYSTVLRICHISAG